MLEARLPKGWKVYRDDNDDQHHDPNFGFKRVDSSGVVVDESDGQRATRSSTFNDVDKNKTTTTTRTTEFPLTTWSVTTGPTPPEATRASWGGRGNARGGGV